MPTAPAKSSTFQISFGREATGVFDPGLPVLAGNDTEQFFSTVRPAGKQGALTLFSAGDWLLGAATVSLANGLEEATHRLYDDIFRAARGRHLARIWNYVPAINEAGPGGLENYRLFCRARSLAFEEHYGRGFKTLLPAASAVGAQTDALTIVFAADSRPPQHFENPLQVSAYDYPVEYGPRAPSFARATVTAGATFISGTAAIRGHATVAPDRTQDQLVCTLENLREISTACGLGPDLRANSSGRRQFKVYVRHAADQPAIAEFLKRHLLRPDDHVCYLRADICRLELNVEIEMTLWS